MSNAGIGWFSGGKEARERAEAVSKRRNLATALTTDLDAELAEVRVSLELDQSAYQLADLERVKKPLSQAQQLMDQIYTDVNLIMSQQVGERISEAEAYELIQPAIRIENKAAELRKWLKRAAEVKNELDRPKTEVVGSLKTTESKRLSVEADLAASRYIVEQMKQEHAENYPQVSAALLTADRENTVASQLAMASQQAVLRQAYREALDLSRRAQSLFDSAAGKLDMIKIEGQKFEKAAGEASTLLDRALKKLQEAKAELASYAPDISADPNTYFMVAVQRIGEARRAIKSNPPQAIYCYRLSNESITLIGETLQRAREEIRRLREGRNEANLLLSQLNEAVTSTKLALNEKQAVPVRAKDLYTEARGEKDKLLQVNINALSIEDLEKYNSSLKVAIKLAETSLNLL